MSLYLILLLKYNYSIRGNYVFFPPLCLLEGLVTSYFANSDYVQNIESTNRLQCVFIHYATNITLKRAILQSEYCYFF